MDAKKLFLENGEAVEPHLCGRCNQLHNSGRFAEECCTCMYCGKYCAFGAAHDECRDRAWNKTTQERLQKASLVADFDGPFLFGGRFYANAAELLTSVATDDLPEFGFCTRYEPPTLDLEEIIDDLRDNHMHDDWEPNDAPELAEAIEAWNEANKDNGTYWEDDTRKWSKADLLKRHAGRVA